ncbi:hypothetical protein AB1Y20_005340 [Prymnesium parvum]|uniref:Cilia- and flagella-associated protein 43 n=1 Tax=Prymnesium parvum TaxID=97485 RepID=A0AB34J3V7_PRYPA
MMLRGEACCALLDGRRAYLGDAAGRVLVCGDDDPVRVQTHDAPICCLLVEDLVRCGGPPGLAVGDARGTVAFYHEWTLLCEHTLPLAITALAPHHGLAFGPAIAAADASGAVLLFGAHGAAWRVRLQDVPRLPPAGAYATALATRADPACDGQGQLVLATGGAALVCLSSAGKLCGWVETRARVSALCTAAIGGDERAGPGGGPSGSSLGVQGERCTPERMRLLLAADGEVHEVEPGEACSLHLFCFVGAQVTSMSPLSSYHCTKGNVLLLACCGHFNGVCIGSECGLLHHIQPAIDDVVCGWPLACRLDHKEDNSTKSEVPGNLDTPDQASIGVQVTVAFCSGDVVFTSETLYI